VTEQKASIILLRTCDGIVTGIQNTEDAPKSGSPPSLLGSAVLAAQTATTLAVETEPLLPII
jgi:hypothetical protein